MGPGDRNPGLQYLQGVWAGLAEPGGVDPKVILPPPGILTAGATAFSLRFASIRGDNPPVTRIETKKRLQAITIEAGKILLSWFGRVRDIRFKGDASSVVCEADLAAEKFVLGELRKHFPDYGIISEEAGRQASDSEYTWVVDPLDGTSNFVAGVPWFGVQIGLLKQGKAVLASMYLPCDELMYMAEAGRGTTRNGDKVSVTACNDLKQVLCAFGFDPGAGEDEARKTVAMLRRIAARVRNVRATNSLVDFCYTVDGRFGGAINLNTKIWDIVPVSLILPEAGGKFTAINGKPIEFDLSAEGYGRSYKILGAAAQLHSRLAKTIFSA